MLYEFVPYFEQLLLVSFKASFLIVAILLVRAMLGKQLSPAWRHAIWGLVPLQLLFCVSLPFAGSVYNLIPQQVALEMEENTPFPYTPQLFQDTPLSLSNTSRHSRAGDQSEKILAGIVDIPVIQDDVNTNDVILEYGYDESPLETAVPLPVITNQEADHNAWIPAYAGTTEDAGTTKEAEKVEFMPILMLVWFVGCVIMGLAFLRQSLLCRRWMRQAEHVENEAVLRLFKDCARKMNIRTWLVIAESRSVSGPLLIGAVRPMLLLPRSVVQSATPTQLQTVFLHELAHLKRWDIWTGWLMTFLLTLHWFNPLLWLAVRKMNADREEACDALALQTLTPAERPDYGYALIDIAQHFVTPARTPGLVGISETGKHLKRRIEMIKHTGTWKLRWKIVAIFAIALIGAATMTDAQDTKPKRSPAEIQAEIDRLQEELKQANEPAPEIDQPYENQADFFGLEPTGEYWSGKPAESPQKVRVGYSLTADSRGGMFADPKVILETCHSLLPNAKIWVDTEHNCLTITGSKAEHEKVENLLKELRKEWESKQSKGAYIGIVRENLPGDYLGTEGDDLIGIFIGQPQGGAYPITIYEDGLPGRGYNANDDDRYTGIATFDFNAEDGKMGLEILLQHKLDGIKEEKVEKVLQKLTATIEVREDSAIKIAIPKNREWDEVRVTKVHQPSLQGPKEPLPRLQGAEGAAVVKTEKQKAEKTAHQAIIDRQEAEVKRKEAKLQLERQKAVNEKNLLPLSPGFVSNVASRNLPGQYISVVSDDLIQKLRAERTSYEEQVRQKHAEILALTKKDAQDGEEARAADARDLVFKKAELERLTKTLDKFNERLAALGTEGGNRFGIEIGPEKQDSNTYLITIYENGLPGKGYDPKNDKKYVGTINLTWNGLGNDQYTMRISRKFKGLQEEVGDKSGLSTSLKFEFENRNDGSTLEIIIPKTDEWAEIRVSKELPPAINFRTASDAFPPGSPFWPKNAAVYQFCGEYLGQDGDKPVIFHFPENLVTKDDPDFARLDGRPFLFGGYGEVCKMSDSLRAFIYEGRDNVPKDDLFQKNSYVGSLHYLGPDALELRVERFFDETREELPAPEAMKAIPVKVVVNKPNDVVLEIPKGGVKVHKIFPKLPAWASVPTERRFTKVISYSDELSNDALKFLLDSFSTELPNAKFQVNHEEREISATATESEFLKVGELAENAVRFNESQKQTQPDPPIVKEPERAESQRARSNAQVSRVGRGNQTPITAPLERIPGKYVDTEGDGRFSIELGQPKPESSGTFPITLYKKGSPEEEKYIGEAYVSVSEDYRRHGQLNLHIAFTQKFNGRKEKKVEEALRQLKAFIHQGTMVDGVNVEIIIPRTRMDDSEWGEIRVSQKWSHDSLVALTAPESDDLPGDYLGWEGDDRIGITIKATSAKLHVSTQENYKIFQITFYENGLPEKGYDPKDDECYTGGAVYKDGKLEIILDKKFDENVEKPVEKALQNFTGSVRSDDGKVHISFPKNSEWDAINATKQ